MGTNVDASKKEDVMPNTGIEPVIFACRRSEGTSATHYHCANQAVLLIFDPR